MPSNTTSSEADNRTVTRRPISRAGTEYWLQRTMIWAYRSTRGVRVSQVGNGSAGSGASSGRSAAKSVPTVVSRFPIRRWSSLASAAARSSLSSAMESTTGIGTQWVRRNRPPSPSTPPFSCEPSGPGWQ